VFLEIAAMRSTNNVSAAAARSGHSTLKARLLLGGEHQPGPGLSLDNQEKQPPLGNVCFTALGQSWNICPSREAQDKLNKQCCGFVGSGTCAEGRPGNGERGMAAGCERSCDVRRVEGDASGVGQCVERRASCSRKSITDDPISQP